MAACNNSKCGGTAGRFDHVAQPKRKGACTVPIWDDI